MGNAVWQAAGVWEGGGDAGAFAVGFSRLTNNVPRKHAHYVQIYFCLNKPTAMRKSPQSYERLTSLRLFTSEMQSVMVSATLSPSGCRKTPLAKFMAKYFYIYFDKQKEEQNAYAFFIFRYEVSVLFKGTSSYTYSRY
jgi:hypothetical protein